MDEYISKQAILKHLNDCKEDPLFDPDMARIWFAIGIFIENMKAADVQPVNQWISVNDRLPENTKPCAVVTEDNGLGVSRYMGRNRFEWTLFGERVLYWMPLPEPPKDGETE